jgi:hypothetical protein
MKNIDYTLLDKLAAGIDKGGEPPDDGDMENRLTALETRFDTILPTLATKTDIESVKTEIHKSTGETHKWMLATVIGLFLGFGGLFLAMSNALKPLPTQLQAAPIIIQVPSQVPPPQPAQK